MSTSAPHLIKDVEAAMISSYPYQYREQFLPQTIVALSKAGVISSTVGEAVTISYKPSQEDAQTIFRSEAARLMSDLLQREPERKWTHAELHAALKERGVVVALNRITYTATKLAEEGYAHKTARQSEIIISRDQVAMLASFVSIVDRLVSNDSTFIAEGKAKAAEIISSPKRFCDLLQKSEQRVPDKTSTDLVTTKERVVTLLAAHPNSTTADVHSYLENTYGQNIGSHRVGNIMTGLCREGAIWVSGKGKGKSHRYSAAGNDSSQ